MSFNRSFRVKWWPILEFSHAVCSSSSEFCNPASAVCIRLDANSRRELSTKIKKKLFSFNQVKMFVVLFVHSFAVLLAKLSPAFLEGCVDDIWGKENQTHASNKRKTRYRYKTLQALFFSWLRSKGHISKGKQRRPQKYLFFFSWKPCHLSWPSRQFTEQTRNWIIVHPYPSPWNISVLIKTLSLSDGMIRKSGWNVVYFHFWKRK